MKQYRIRKEVLNLTVDQWQAYKEIAHNADIMVISIKSALKNFGVMGMLTLKANEEEVEFIQELYKELRKDQSH